jgi:hypothetical protein
VRRKLVIEMNGEEQPDICGRNENYVVFVTAYFGAFSLQSCTDMSIYIKLLILDYFLPFCTSTCIFPLWLTVVVKSHLLPLTVMHISVFCVS